MSWQLSIVLFYVFSVSNTLWSRVYTQKSKLPGKVPPAIGYILGLTPIGLLISLFSHNVHIHWTLLTITLLIIEGFFIALFNWLSFIALKKSNVTQFQTVFQIYAVTATLLGWLLLSEKLTFIQTFGSLLLLIGALLAARAGQTKHLKFSFSKGVVLTAASAVCLGIGLVAERAALKQMTLGSYFIFGFATQTIALLVIAMKDLKQTHISMFNAYELKGSFLIGLLSALGGSLYIHALYRAQNIGLVVFASTFQLPLSVVAGFLLLKERENIVKLSIACLIAFAGLLLMVL